MRGLLLGALTALLCSATRYDPIPGKPDGGSASSPAGSDAAQAGSSCLRDTRSGFAPLCSFASAFAQRDLQTQAGRANFMDLAVAAEAKFHSPGLSYDAATGLTYDGHTVDAVTGELSGGPRLWSSAAKESLHLSVLAVALGGDALAGRFVNATHPAAGAAQAAALLSRKIASLWRFHSHYPGYAGFLPWFTHSHAAPSSPSPPSSSSSSSSSGTASSSGDSAFFETSSSSTGAAGAAAGAAAAAAGAAAGAGAGAGATPRTGENSASAAAADNTPTLSPAHDWLTRVPALDNGELAWAVFAVAHASREAGFTDISNSYSRYFALMARWADKLFYESGGRVRAEARISDIRADPGSATYTNNVAGYFLEDPFEGELMAMLLTLYGTSALPAAATAAAAAAAAASGSASASAVDPGGGSGAQRRRQEQQEEASVAGGGGGSIGGQASHAEAIWRHKRGKLEAVNFQVPAGFRRAGGGGSGVTTTTFVPVQRGFWFSAHEQWKFLQLPYLDVPITRRVFLLGEKVRTWDGYQRAGSAAEDDSIGVAGKEEKEKKKRRAVGLHASVHTLDRSGNLQYMSACGVEKMGSQPVSAECPVTPYGAFPTILAATGITDSKGEGEGEGEGIAAAHNQWAGLAWYHAVLAYPGMQGPFGSLESYANSDDADDAETSATKANGHQGKPVPVLTWDAKVTTVLAMLGGTGSIVRRGLEWDGLYGTFVGVVEAEYSPVFPSLAGESPPDWSGFNELPFAWPPPLAPQQGGVPPSLMPRCPDVVTRSGLNKRHAGQNGESAPGFLGMIDPKMLSVKHVLGNQDGRAHSSRLWCGESLDLVLSAALPNSSGLDVKQALSFSASRLQVEVSSLPPSAIHDFNHADAVRQSQLSMMGVELSPHTVAPLCSGTANPRVSSALFHLPFKLSRGGNLTVSVKLMEVHIRGSPFSFKVASKVNRLAQRIGGWNCSAYEIVAGHGSITCIITKKLHGKTSPLIANRCDLEKVSLRVGIRNSQSVQRSAVALFILVPPDAAGQLVSESPVERGYVGTRLSPTIAGLLTLDSTLQNSVKTLSRVSIVVKPAAVSSAASSFHCLPNVLIGHETLCVMVFRDQFGNVAPMKKSVGSGHSRLYFSAHNQTWKRLKGAHVVPASKPMPGILLARFTVPRLRGLHATSIKMRVDVHGIKRSGRDAFESMPSALSTPGSDLGILSIATNLNPLWALHHIETMQDAVSKDLSFLWLPPSGHSKRKQHIHTPVLHNLLVDDIIHEQGHPAISGTVMGLALSFPPELAGNVVADDCMQHQIVQRLETWLESRQRNMVHARWVMPRLARLSGVEDIRIIRVVSCALLSRHHNTTAGYPHLEVPEPAGRKHLIPSDVNVSDGFSLNVIVAVITVTVPLFFFAVKRCGMLRGQQQVSNDDGGIQRAGARID